MTTAARIDRLEDSRDKHGERLGAIERTLERMTAVMQLQIWVMGLVGTAVIVGILARLAKLI